MSLLLGDRLGLVLLLTDEVAEPSQSIADGNQRSCDYRFPASKDTITATFLVFRTIRVEDVLLLVIEHGEGVVDVGEGGVFDIPGLGLEDGDSVIDGTEGAVANLIGLGYVWGDVGDWLFQVGQGWRDELVVAILSEGDGFGAIRV